MATSNSGYKISKKIERELIKTRRNYLNKIARVEKKDTYGTSYVPNKPKNVKEILKEVTNGRELRAEINKMRRYLKRNAEKQVSENIEISNYEYEELKRLQRKALKRNKEELDFLKNTELKRAGTPLGVTIEQTGTDAVGTKKSNREKILKSLKSEVITREDYEKKKDFLKFQASNDRSLKVLKENYIQMLYTLGKTIGVSDTIIEGIADKIMKVNAKEFYNIYQSDVSVKILMEHYHEFRKTIKKGKVYKMADRRGDKDLFNSLYTNIDYIM
ncbi:MAG: hypothetical protein NC200_07835 [Candidatus Gastranaerophilales bacterium]|nr:hypothetical protein [Candidatus Gastranaerophilales bacterium]